ncbi:MAG TPA: glutamine synthetase family protein [Candidatus Binataceae bacterium]|nr:glutamine synthetase family protein [Candidatus Binataceae bacterium]
MAADTRTSTIGRPGFIGSHGLWTDDQKEAAARVISQLDSGAIETVRVSIADQHGVLRAKLLTARAFSGAMENGLAFTNALFIFDTGNAFVFNPFEKGGGFGRAEMEGCSDIIVVPDPTTFRLLPWSPGTGWVTGDVYFPNGEPFPYAPRYQMRRALDELHRHGFEYLAGLEVEWYLTRLDDPMLEIEHVGAVGVPPPPARVRPVTRGFQLANEAQIDEVDQILQVLRKNLEGAGLPLRTLEAEFGPGQQEFTFDPLAGLAAADAMVFFRSAARQICRRNGYHASFMCKPALGEFFTSGWHLHQSLLHRDSGTNAFMASTPDEPLSEIGLRFMGGILKHAAAASVFSTPTINGYRRFKPNSLAPDRVTWAIDNKAAMLRVQGAGDQPSVHIENRAGEPAANPYLYMASQIVSGLDGIINRIDPGPPDELPYAAAGKATLPVSLPEALAALKQDRLFETQFGAEVIDYIAKLKASELGRFMQYLDSAGLTLEDCRDRVTEWEQREYFELF